MGPEQIAKRLEREKVLVPTEYAYRKFGRGHSSRNPDFPYRWSGSSVADILENPDYIGIQTSCKTHKPSYKSDLVVEVPELTPEILREFFHHITVHERDGAYRKKFYTQKIDIHFNYIGTMSSRVGVVFSPPPPEYFTSLSRRGYRLRGFLIKDT